MVLIARAWRNLRRNPGRTALIAAALTVVVALGVIGLVVEAGARDGISGVRRSLGSEVVLGPNVAGLRGRAAEDLRRGDRTVMGFVAPVTEELAQTLATSPFVVGVNHSFQGRASSASLVPVEENATGISLIPGGLVARRPNGFTLMGHSTPDRIADFTGDRRSIVAGRLYTAEEVAARAPVAVIDEVLAAQNGVELGGTITLTGSAGAEVELAVVGIFRDEGMPSADGNLPPGPGMALFGHANTIYLPHTVAQDLMGRPGELSSTTYFLDDPDHIDDFRAQAELGGLDTERYTLWSADTQFDVMSAPLQKLAGFAHAGVVAVIVAGALVICLVMTIVTRERSLEIGVLRALGATRGTVAAQLTVETLTLCLVAVVLGVVIGGVLAQGVANQLLTREAALAGQNMGIGRGLMGRNGTGVFQWPGSPVQGPAGTVETRVGLAQVGAIAGIGLLLGLLGSLVAGYWSMKTHPASILAGRA